jgi:hypothetical protein
MLKSAPPKDMILKEKLYIWGIFLNTYIEINAKDIFTNEAKILKELIDHLSSTINFEDCSKRFILLNLNILEKESQCMLRRLIENEKSIQFIFTAESQSGIIPALCSRLSVEFILFSQISTIESKAAEFGVENSINLWKLKLKHVLIKKVLTFADKKVIIDILVQGVPTVAIFKEIATICLLLHPDEHMYITHWCAQLQVMSLKGNFSGYFLECAVMYMIKLNKGISSDFNDLHLA